MHGKLNAPGGKIKMLEKPLTAMVREFKEETDLFIPSWKKFGELNVGAGEIVYLFTSDSDDIYKFKKTTDEQPIIFNYLDLLGAVKLMKNILWMIPMARNCLLYDSGYYVVEESSI